jgi:hypothetical protein
MLSDALASEFVTVDAVLGTRASTRCVDAFALTWIKAEKQLRRLVCFLVFQSQDVSDSNRQEYEAVIVENRDLYLNSFITCFDALSTTSLRDLVGSDYDEFLENIRRMRDYRRKLLHGQVTGQRLTSRQLEDDVTFLRTWIETVARVCGRYLGYDGIGRNTYRRAKAVKRSVVAKYPFSAAGEFKDWLRRHAKRDR